MKKSKVLALTVLSVILCLMIMCTSSFSWFTRGTQTGGYFSWTNDDSNTALSYNTSNGSGISMATYSSPDGNTYGDTEVTALSNSNGLAAGDRKYYRTDITNSSSADQSVSLYLSNLETSGNGNFYLGVNDPLKTYKNYSNAGAVTNAVSSTVNKRNIYVGFNENQTYTYSDYRLYYETKSGKTGEAVVGSSKIGYGEYTASQYANYKANYNMSYATVPYDTKTVKLKYKDGYDGYGGAYTISDTDNTVILFEYDKSYHSALVQSGFPAALNTFYSSVTIGVGDTLDIHADCKGTTVEYSSDSSAVSVTRNGVITGVSKGTATITVTVKGAYNNQDKNNEIITSQCVVTVDESTSDIPIVTNLKIPAKGDKDTVVSVYWYIKNDSDNGNLTYTIDDLYLSL